MSKKHDHVNVPLASSDRDIPQAAAEAFRAAHIKALNSKAGVIVVRKGKLVHCHLKQGKLITEQVGDAPQPLIVGAGTRKKRNNKSGN